MFYMTRPADKRFLNGVSNAVTMRIVLSMILIVTLLIATRFDQFQVVQQMRLVGIFLEQSP